MAQSIKLKRSAVVGKTPQTSSLELGELGINTTDGKIYFHRSGSSDDTIQSVLTTDATITGSLKLSGSQHISGSVGVMDDITFIGDMSSSLTSTSSFSRLISVATASIGYLEVTGSNFAVFDTETGSFASGSDVQQILAESASYVVDSDTGSLHQVLAESASYLFDASTASLGDTTLAGDITGSITSTGSFGKIFGDGSDLDNVADPEAISGSYLGLLSGSNDLTLGLGVSGSLTSTGSFGKLLGDGGDLTNVADPEAISGSYLGLLSGSHDLSLGLGVSGSLTSTASFGTLELVDVTGLPFATGSDLHQILAESSSYVVESETGSFVVNSQTSSFASGSDVQTISDTYASGSDIQIILAESASYVTSTSTGSYLQQAATASLGAVGITDTLFVSGNITTSGSVIAREFKTELVSSSIIYSSGSNEFGDTIDDTHIFTGSILLTGSLTMDTGSIILEDGDISGSILSNASFGTLELADSHGFVLSTDTGSLASGSDVSQIQALTASYASGSDLHQFLAESASYVVDSDTGSLHQVLAESASYLVKAETASLGKVTLLSDITGSITSTGSFGKLFGDGGSLTNVADPDAISGSFQGGGSTNISGSITSTGSFGSLVVNGNVDMPDSAILTLGNSSDIQLVHNGTDNFIQTFGGGDLTIVNNADDKDILFQSDDDSGGVKTYLQLDGSEGNVRIPDSVELNLGNSQDFRIVHDGSNTHLKNYTGTLFISSLGTNGDIIFQVDQGGQDQRLMFLDGSRDAVSIGRRTNGGTLDPGDDKLLVAGDVGVTGSLFVSSSITTQGDILGNISSSASSTSSLGALNLHNTLSVSSQSGHLNGGPNNIPLLVSRNNSKSSTLALVSTGSAGYANYMQFLTSELNQMGSVGFTLGTNNKFTITSNMQNQDMIFQVQDATNTLREALRIDSSANRVGIYNSSPTKELVVSGAISASGDLFIDDINTTGTFTNTTGTLKVSQSVSDGDIEISVNDGGSTINAITIDASAVGNVALPNDNQQLRIGVGNDLKLYHDATNSYITNATGRLIISQQTDNSFIDFKNDDGSGGVTTYLSINGLNEFIDVRKTISASLGTTGSFDRLEGNTLNATISPFASGSDVSQIQAQTGSYATGSDLHQFLAESASYLNNDTTSSFGAVSMDSTLFVQGNITTSGSVTAQEFHTEVVSSSVIYESGSTQFGDTLDDTHKITGSLGVTGSIAVGKPVASYNLDVNRSTAGVIAQFQFGDDTDGRIQIYADGNAGSVGNDTGLAGETIYFQDDLGLRFIANSAERMRVTTGGVLAIGATSFGTADNTKLLVAGDTGITGSLSVSSSIKSITGNYGGNISGSITSTGSFGSLVSPGLSTLGIVSATSLDADGGVTIDNITIDGTEIDLSSGDLTIDVAGDIDLDAGGQQIKFSSAGTAVGQIDMAGTDLEIKSLVSNATFTLRGNDGGSEIDMLAFDVAGGGNATFLANVSSSITSTGSFGKIDAVNNIDLPDNGNIRFGASQDMNIVHNGTDSFVDNYTGDLKIRNNANDKDIIFLSDDGSGGTTSYFYLDGSSTKTIFAQSTQHADNAKATFGAAGDFEIYHDGSHNYFDTNNGNIYFRDDADNNIFLIYREGNGVQLAEGNITIPATSKVIFDGATSGHSHIAESAADIMDFTVGGDLMLRLDEASNKVNVPQSEFMVSASYGWFKNSMGGSTDNVEVIRLGAMIDSPNNPLAKFFVDDNLDLIEYNMLRYGAKHRFTRGSAAGGRVNMMTVEGSATTQFKLWHQSNNVGGGDTTGSAVIYLNATTGSGQSYINSGGGLSIATGSVIIGGTSATNSKLNVKSEGSTQSVIRIDGDDGRGANRYALDIVDDDSNSRGSVRISTTSGPSLIVNGNVTGSIATTASFGKIVADQYSLATLAEVSGGLTSTGSFGHLVVVNGINAVGRTELNGSLVVNTGIVSSKDETLSLRRYEVTNNSIDIGDGQQDFKMESRQVLQLNASGTTGFAGISGSLTMSGSIIPLADNHASFDLGSASKRWNDVFAVQTTVGAVFETGLRSKGIGKEETGTIVVWRNGGLVPCDKSEDTMVMGVTKKGKDEPIVMGAEPVLVTGDIKEGDFITTSTKQGHGKKLENGYLLKKEMFGKVIAQALEDSSGESSLIKCMIRKM